MVPQVGRFCQCLDCGLEAGSGEGLWVSCAGLEAVPVPTGDCTHPIVISLVLRRQWGNGSL